MRSFHPANIDTIVSDMGSRLGPSPSLQRIGGYLGRSDVFLNAPQGTVLKVFYDSAERKWTRERICYKALQDTGFPCPRLMGQGHLSGGDPWILLEFKQGTILEAGWSELGEQTERQLYHLLGRVHACLHHVPVETIGEYDALVEQAWSGYMDRAINILNKKYPDRDLFAAAREEISVLAQGLCVAKNRTCLVHRDLTPRNVLVDNSPAVKIISVIDFERARIGDPVEDFAMLFFKEFISRPDLIKPFLDGYLEKGKLAAGTGQLLRLHVLGLLIEIGDWAFADDREYYARAVKALKQVLTEGEHWIMSTSLEKAVQAG